MADQQAAANPASAADPTARHAPARARPAGAVAPGGGGHEVDPVALGAHPEAAPAASADAERAAPSGYGAGAPGEGPEARAQPGGADPATTHRQPPRHAAGAG